MATRLNKRHQEAIREKIRGSQLVNVIEKHVFDEYKAGEKRLEPSQITAAMGLLKKVVPDLQATEIDATVQDDRVESMSDAQLIAIAGGKGK